jgi:hypothetical protein
MRALKYDQQTSVDAAKAVTEWMLQFSGISWTTRDVPACGLGCAPPSQSILIYARCLVWRWTGSRPMDHRCGSPLRGLTCARGAPAGGGPRPPRPAAIRRIFALPQPGLCRSAGSDCCAGFWRDGGGQGGGGPGRRGGARPGHRDTPQHVRRSAGAAHARWGLLGTARRSRARPRIGPRG